MYSVVPIDSLLEGHMPAVDQVGLTIQFPGIHTNHKYVYILSIMKVEVVSYLLKLRT